jgi:hypothetical protein
VSLDSYKSIIDKFYLLYEDDDFNDKTINISKEGNVLCISLLRPYDTYTYEKQDLFIEILKTADSFKIKKHDDTYVELQFTFKLS